MWPPETPSPPPRRALARRDAEATWAAVLRASLSTVILMGTAGFAGWVWGYHMGETDGGITECRLGFDRVGQAPIVWDECRARLGKRWFD